MTMSESKEIPTFSSFDEMQKYLEEQERKNLAPAGKTNKSTKNKRTGKTRSRSRAGKHSAEQAQPKVESTVNNSTVWKTEHYFIRVNDDWNNCLKDAKFALTQANVSNTLIFAHHHEFGASCSDSCREVVN